MQTTKQRHDEAGGRKEQQRLSIALPVKRAGHVAAFSTSAAQPSTGCRRRFGVENRRLADALGNESSSRCGRFNNAKKRAALKERRARKKVKEEG
jgi:hypothetical protein